MEYRRRDASFTSGQGVPGIGFYVQPTTASTGLPAAVPGYAFYHVDGRVYGKPVAASQLLPSAICYPIPVTWQHGGSLPMMFMNQYQALPYHATRGQSPIAYSGHRLSQSRRTPKPLPVQPPAQQAPPPSSSAVTPAAGDRTSEPSGIKDENICDSGWGWLLEGVLQQVLQGVPGPDVRNFRQVCKHWREVADQNLETLSPSCLKSKTILVRFPRLRVLRLINCPNVRNRDLFILSQGQLPLQVLTIGDESNKPWVTNRGLSSIAQISSIRSLSLHDCNSVTNKGLACLVQMKKLKCLSLRGCKKITNTGLDVLEHLTALTSINLVGCIRISDKALLPLRPLKLEAIQLGGTRIHDEGMSYLAKLTSLRELQCTNAEISDTGLQELTSLTKLERLALQDCCDVNGAGLLALLRHLPNLTHLDLCRNYDFDDEQLATCLPYLSGLRSLDLRGTWITDKGIACLPVLSRLDTLSLAPHLDMFADSLCVISVLTGLTSLTVTGCAYITRGFLRAMRCLSMLRSLDLSDDAFTENLAVKEPMKDSSAVNLATLTTLTSLDLSRRLVRQDQLDLIASKLKLLLSMSICGCPITARSSVQLQKKYPRLVIICKDSKHDVFAPDVRVVVTA